MNTTQLECFLEVSNFLNFSRAAEHLRITQPAVSHQINTLEDELGVKLFRRTSKSVRLTQEGYLFTQYAGEILKLEGLSRARLRECQETLPARLSIGCRSTMELRLLRPALSVLRLERPEVLPLLRLIPSDSVESLLTEGELELLFSFQEPSAKKMHCHLLARCPVACVCALDHPLAGEKRVTAAQISQAGPIAACRPPICPPPLFPIQNQILAQRGPHQILFCDTQEAALTMVEAGYAITLTADLPAGRLPGLRYLPMPEFEPLPFYGVHRSGERSAALRSLLNLLEETLMTEASAAETGPLESNGPVGRDS